MIKEKIERILREKFHPLKLEVTDDSHLHAGHAEAKKSGGGHFSVMITSEMFEGKKSVERHRMVYEALADELKGNIHALAIKAMTPNKMSE